VNINISLKQILSPTYSISFAIGEYNNHDLGIQYSPNVVCILQILNTTLDKKLCNNKEEKDRGNYHFPL
jgi:hypothetical protein